MLTITLKGLEEDRQDQVRQGHLEVVRQGLLEVGRLDRLEEARPDRRARRGHRIRREAAAETSSQR